MVTPGTLARRSDFYFQLSNLINAGVPIIQAMEMLRKSASGSWATQLDRAIHQMHGGATLTEALQASRSWFSEFDLALVQAGEQSGRLDACLKLLGNYYQEQSTLTRQILSDLAYPLFLIHLAFFVFPTRLLTGLFMAGGTERFLNNKITLLGIFWGVILVTLFLGGSKRGQAWGGFVTRILNAIPVLGRARRNLAIGRFAAALEALLAAGAPVLHSWELAAAASGSAEIRRSVQLALPRIQAGMTPAEVLGQMTVFPEMFRNLYTSGEISGRLDDTLTRLHRYYQEQASSSFKNFGQWLPRIIFLVIALAIAFQIVSFYGAYFSGLPGLE